jgi:hypothetical protein
MAPTQVYIMKVVVPVTQAITTELAATDFMASTNAKTKFSEGVAAGLTTGAFTFTSDMIVITGAADGTRRVRRGLTANVLSINYDVVLQKTSSGVDGADSSVQATFASIIKASTLTMVNNLLAAPALLNAIAGSMASATKADGTAIPAITSVAAPPAVLASAVTTVEFGNPSQAPTAAPTAAPDADDEEGMSGAVVGAIVAVAVLIIAGGAYSFMKSPADKKVLPSSLEER